MKSAKAILTALFAVVGAVGASANVYIPVKDPGVGIEVRKLHILQGNVGADTIGFVSKTPDLYKPYYLGRCGGRVVSAVYEGDCVMRMFYVGNEPFLYEGCNLEFEVDSVANRAVFSRANRSVEIDFNRADAIDRLVRFVSPQKGRKREGYTYVYGGDPRYGFVTRSTLVAELPNALADRRRMLDAITSHIPDNDKTFETERNYDFPDTVYYVSPKPEINSMYDYVCAEAQMTGLNGPMCLNPLPADSTVGRNYRISRFVEYIPVWFTDTLMTIYKFDNSVYPAGGGGSSHNSYTTYVTRGDKTVRLTAEDIFRPEKYNEVKRVFIERLSKELGAANELNDDGSVWPNVCQVYVSFFYNGRVLYSEAHEHGYERRIDYVQNEKIRNNDYTGVIMPDVALLPDGVMFTYDMSLLTDFGEDGLTTLFVPYNALKGCFRPGMEKTKPF